MGEHGTWFDYLNRFSWWQDVSGDAREVLARKDHGGAVTNTLFKLIGPSHFTLTHVLVAFVVLMFVMVGTFSFKSATAGGAGLIPPRKMTLRNFFEVMAETVYGMVEGAMGEHNAKRFFPLIGTLWLFILLGNLIGLIPGFVSPNDTVKTNLALAATVFFATHIYGFKENGIGYLKHFLGPSLVLAPLMVIIEVISHLARPISLTLRLMGNMIADHKVVFSFFTLVPWFVPLPFYLLGLLVCLIQAIVFCTLTMVYLSMAVEHDDH
jgi:F-type H+-transporting ATPase subunit a